MTDVVRLPVPITVMHKNVLRATREVMEKLGVSARLSFEPSEYMDETGKMRPMIRFSDDVLFPVVAAVGGKVEYQLLYRANVWSPFSRLIVLMSTA